MPHDKNVRGTYAILFCMNIIRKFVNSVSAFLSVAGKSCYDLEFYRGVRTRTVGSAFRYALSFHFALTLFAAALFVPASLGAKAALTEYLTKTIPENASVSVSHGQLTTTLSVPYELGNDSFHVIVDPAQEGIAFPDKLKTVGILMGRDAMFIRSQTNGMQVRELKTLPDMTVSRNRVMELLSQFSGWAMAAALLAFSTLFLLIFLGSTMVTVASYSLFAWLFGKLWRTNLRYSAWFATGLHAVTLPVLVDMLFGAIGLPVPFAFTVIYFLIMGSVITDERSQPTSGDNSVPTATEMAVDEEVDALSPDEEKKDDEEGEEETEIDDKPKDEDRKPPKSGE